MGIALAALLFAFPTLAADNYDVIDAHGATRTMGAKDQGGVLHGKHLLAGLAASVPTPTTMTVPGQPDINCVTG